MSWEGEYGRGLRAEETVALLRTARAEREGEAVRRAMGLGLIATVTELCPQCWTVLWMPSDAVEAICGDCGAMMRRTAYGWEVHG